MESTRPQDDNHEPQPSTGEQFALALGRALLTQLDADAVRSVMQSKRHGVWLGMVRTALYDAATALRAAPEALEEPGDPDTWLG